MIDSSLSVLFCSQILTNANTITSALMGSAGTQRAPSSVCATRVTERLRWETTVKVSTWPCLRTRTCYNPRQCGVFLPAM